MYFVYKYVYFYIKVSTPPHPSWYTWARKTSPRGCTFYGPRLQRLRTLSRIWSRLFQSLTPDCLVIMQSLCVTCLFSSLPIHPLFTIKYRRSAAQQQHVFHAPLHGWDCVTNILLSQEETTACVMLSIVCSPLGSFLTKTKIVFAKFMGVEEKVRWLLGLWCFCHYRKVCSVRYVQ